MIRLAAATIALIALTGSFAFAQAPTPKVQVFGGYSLIYVDNGGLSSQALYTGLRQSTSALAVESNFHGWDAQAQYNVNHWLGFAADVGGRSGTPIIASRFGGALSGLPNATGYSFLGGPVLSFRNKSRFTPFVHTLFGVDRYSQSASTISGLSSPVSTLATTYTDVAAALGGGLDIKVTRRFAVRLPQVEDLYTTHNLNKFYDSAFNTGLFEGLATHEHNWRISAGIVASF
ncbi:MAG: hypothetical protein WCA49_09675 [Candidatus Sulfotelmatobacter sp.]